MSRKLLLIVLSIFLLTPLSGAVEATYQARPVLNFQKFDDIYQQRYGGTGGNPFSGKLATHIGTFTVNTGGATVRNFALNSTHDNNFSFTGPRTTGAGTFGFHAASVVKYGNGLWGTALYYPPKHPIQPTNHAMNGTVVIDFYLVSWEDASFFVEDGAYTHESGKMPPFSVTFSTTAKDFWSAAFDPMSVNGGTPGQTLPYLYTGTEEFPDEEISYGDPPDLVSYSFTITGQRPIKLADAFGNKRAEVATANLSLTNADASKSYGVEITFTNAVNTNPFQMVNDDLAAIPYKLYFNDQIITPGAANDWDGLTNGIHSQPIEVTRIDQNMAQLLPTGTYKDTIYVTITPKDTV